MISVTILTKNSERHLKEVLEALTQFDEVVVYDTGSTDTTEGIAKSFSNVSFYEGAFVGFGKTHNAASACAKHDWIFSVDSDEVAPAELINEIFALELKGCYSVSRKNFFNGKWIWFCGWSPDRVTRIYNRRETEFSDAEVHEAVITTTVISLKNSLHHFPYASQSDFLRKMQSYSELFAKQRAGKVRSSFAKAFFRGFYTFFKNYIMQWGIFGGKEGFMIAFYNGATTYFKYLKLAEYNSRQTPSHPTSD